LDTGDRTLPKVVRAGPVERVRVGGRQRVSLVQKGAVQPITDETTRATF
jgi:hypothetical protein